MFLFANEFFVGCEDIGPSGDWIYVALRPSGYLIKKNKSTGEELCDSTTKNVEGTIIVSVSNENYPQYYSARTDSNCYFIIYWGEIKDVKLYQGQSITIKISAWPVPSGYTQIPSAIVLTYDEAISNAPSNSYYEYHKVIKVIWLYE